MSMTMSSWEFWVTFLVPTMFLNFLKLPTKMLDRVLNQPVQQILIEIYVAVLISSKCVH